MGWNNHLARWRQAVLDLGPKVTENEHTQAVIRLGFWLVVTTYFGIGLVRGTYRFDVAVYLQFSAGFLCGALLILFSIRRRPRFRPRVYLVLVYDMFATAVAMVLTGGSASPFFLIYVWLFVSYVTRYGRPMWYAALVLSVVSYGMVLVATEAWKAPHVAILVHLSVLIILPAYLYQLLNDLVRARREADAANRAKSRFLAHMSHEIRNPLAGVAGMVDLLAATSLDDKQRDYVQSLGAAANALHALVDDVLDFSKIEAGRLELHERVFQPRAVLREVLDTLRPVAAAKGIDLVLEPGGGLPASVWGDPHRLRQVLFNLVGNAIKFTERGRVTVRCRKLNDALDGRLPVRVEVEDTGIGIPPDRLDQVFESYTQADESIAPRFGGTGLGTTISRELVRLMGGKIGVRSRLGKGSTFWFEIPWREAGAEPPVMDRGRVGDTADDAGGHGPAAASSGALPRVLVVDDSAINAKVVAAFLQSAGYTVDVAVDGRQALGLLRAGRYGMAFVDRHMPEMDGLELVRAWRKEESGARHLPMVALTANAAVEDERQCLDAGMDGFLTKPVSRERLLQEVQRLVSPRVDEQLFDRINRVSLD